MAASSRSGASRPGSRPPTWVQLAPGELYARPTDRRARPLRTHRPGDAGDGGAPGLGYAAGRARRPARLPGHGLSTAPQRGVARFACFPESPTAARRDTILSSLTDA